MKLNRPIAAALATTALAALVACSGNSKPEDALQGFFKSVGDADYDKAMAMLDPKIFSMLPREKVRAGLEGMRNDAKQCDGFKSIEPKLSGEGSKRKGTVVLTYASPKCPPKTKAIEMTQVDGQWLLLL